MSMAMSLFGTLGRAWLIPANPRMVRWGRRRVQPSSYSSFRLCELNKLHLLAIAIGLAVVILLLIIFAYHGGYGLFVVSVGLAFIVFGPLLVCKSLMHAYYRQMQLEARTGRTQTERQTQTNENDERHVYACIIIAPRDVSQSSMYENQHNHSDLPTYEEAMISPISVPTHRSTVDSDDISCAMLNQTSQDENNVELTIESETNSIEMQPPSYRDALAAIETHDRMKSATDDDDVEGQHRSFRDHQNEE